MDHLRIDREFLSEEKDYRPVKQSSLYFPKRQTSNLLYSTGAAAIFSLLISSCAVVLVGPYDEITDKAITDLETKTEQFFMKAESIGVSYEDTKSFVSEAKGSLRAIRLRSELYGADKNKGELTDIDLLDQNFDNLMELRKTGSLSNTAWKAARTSIEINFQALLQIELAKKRSSGVSEPKAK
jgi:hypothetical protein